MGQCLLFDRCVIYDNQQSAGLSGVQLCFGCAANVAENCSKG